MQRDSTAASRVKRLLVDNFSFLCWLSQVLHDVKGLVRNQPPSRFSEHADHMTFTLNAREITQLISSIVLAAADFDAECIQFMKCF